MEDYPGQGNDRRRFELVEHSVCAGDRILMAGADGSVEELDYLTAAVAAKWAEKARVAACSRLLAKDMRERKS